MIDASTLDNYLQQKDESPRIEFKLKYDLSGQNKGKYQDELAKDLLALTNTAGRSQDDFAYLIIGAGNVLKSDGTRDKFDVRGFNFKPEYFLQIINARCSPPVQEFRFSEIELNGNFYGVIKIPPSPYIHELSRNLDTPKSSWPRGSVLIRRGSEVGTASPNEIKLMEREKSRSGMDASAPTLLEQLEANLHDSSKSIAVKNLIFAEAKQLRASLSDPVFLAPDKDSSSISLIERMDAYEQLTANFLELFAVSCHHAEEKLSSVWSDVLTTIGGASEDGCNSDLLLRLRRYPPLLLLYAGGVAAVAGERYQTLAALLNKAKVRIWSRSEDVTFLAPGRIVSSDDQKRLKESSENKMALELHLREYLREPLDRLFPNADKYLDSFTRFEYLYALNSLKKGEGIIRGSYMWASELRRKRSQSYLQNSIAVVSESNAEIEISGAKWLPFKSDIFACTWDEFLAFKKIADEKILDQASNYLTRGY